MSCLIVKNCLINQNNRAFIQSVYMIENYCDSADGYERILSDLGIPQEDVVKIATEISNYKDIVGTENKLKQTIGKEFFNKLSPFSKRIIQSL